MQQQQQVAAAPSKYISTFLQPVQSLPITFRYLLSPPSSESQHLKADGTPDERFRENKDQEAQPQQQQSTSPTTVSGETSKENLILERRR